MTPLLGKTEILKRVDVCTLTGQYLIAVMPSRSVSYTAGAAADVDVTSRAS